MAYLGLARKWRPQTFDDLVGQSHIARTISNAIKAERVSQGYLFTGTRGIGKTSAARIFAKVLRCSAAQTLGTSCNQCNDCIEIAEGRSVDVLEIDGASNNGVDAVREIRENAKYLPSTGKYKIYIIDEVHMLTTAAFNALLKTLEEPPAHVVFIFATTDPQKIPATVLSRCQRFDFKRVSQKDLNDRLRYICDAEKVEITNDALTILTREAEGSMRDAVSLLDQVFAVGDGKLTAETITNALGLIDKKTVLECVTSILKREPLNAIEAVGKVYLHGFDLKQFGRELLRQLRQLMIVKLLERTPNVDLSTYLDVSDVDLADLKNLAGVRSLDDLDMLFRLLNFGLEDMARSSIPKIVMDMLVVKMASSEELVNLSEIESPDRFFLSKNSANASSVNTAPSVDLTRGPIATAPAPQAIAPPPIQKTNSAQEEFMQQLAQMQRPQARTQSNPSALLTASKTPSPSQETPPLATKAELPTNGAANGLEWWQKVVVYVRAQKPLIASILEHMSFEGFSSADENGLVIITLGFTKDHSFYKDQLQSRAYNDLLTQLMKNYLGRAVRLEYKEVLSNKSLQEIEREKSHNLAQMKRKAVLESEAIRATEQLLGAKLERLEIDGP